ncbi:MAG: hypothetical protein MJK15_08185 [Colwellia sp.]|nr:hypothetical protein [Colwellia sp.]
MPNYTKVNKIDRNTDLEVLTEEVLKLVGHIPVQKQSEKIEFIKMLVEEDAWITCDCNQTRNIAFPVQGEHTWYFKNHSNNSPHEKDCHIGNKTTIKVNEEDIVVIRPVGEEIFDICKKGRIASGDGSPDSNGEIQRRVRLAKLGRLLLKVMVAANINEESTGVVPDAVTKFKALRKAIGEERYDIDHYIKDILFTDFERFSHKQEEIKNWADNWSSERTEPHAFVLCLITKVTRIDNNYEIEYLVLNDDESGFTNAKFKIFNSYFNSKFKTINGRISLENGGPWIGVFVMRHKEQYKNKPETANYFPVRAFIYPICSVTNLFPVDSNKERETYKKIEDLLDYNRSKNKQVRVRKPLYAEPNTNSNIELDVIHPDFIIDSNKECILEVMGLSETDYVERKIELKKYYEDAGTAFVELDATNDGLQLETEINDKVKTAFLKALGFSK